VLSRDHFFEVVNAGLDAHYGVGELGEELVGDVFGHLGLVGKL
jgi:hypothetical protein